MSLVVVIAFCRDMDKGRARESLASHFSALVIRECAVLKCDEP